MLLLSIKMHVYARTYVNNGRVIGGSDAKPNTWKWQISLQLDLYNEGSFSHICGGSIVDSFYIMTAAHCIIRWVFLLGCQSVPLHLCGKKIIVHPDWNGDLANGNDIALLKLVNPNYDNGYVEITNLPYPDQTLPHGFTCYITGWGLMDCDLGTPAVVEHAACSQPEWWGSIALKTMVCAGGDGLMIIFQGDSGGPLNCLTDGVWRVHGVVSYGPAGVCNQKFKPTVFTRVSSFLHWMYSVNNMHEATRMK
uniref:Peptidase S1 domain-containing protein n=1 Tax=Poecilia latipinna TaxID=48699 RepID=A0A3B3VV38_9TELE